MTTTVTITTHDWPVEVRRVNTETGQTILSHEKVAPHAQAVFYVTDTNGLFLKELPKPASVLTA